MTITANGYHGTIHNPIIKPYKIYAVTEIIPHPMLDGVSICRHKNGKATIIRTQDIIDIRK